tara:strand:+ start:1720 stop:1947 length:228 start_codon:yes stop_codon:yes gene_type:complete
METKVIKFNLRDFIDQYIFLHESKDKEGERILLENFNKLLDSSSGSIVLGIQGYLTKTKITEQYPVLKELSVRLF